MRISRLKEKQKINNKKRIIKYILIVYFILVIISLFAVDYSFNEIEKGIHKENLLSITKNNKKLDVVIFGEKFIFDIEYLFDKLNYFGF